MSQHHGFMDLLKALTRKRMLVVFFLGFSSGLPIMLLYSSLKIWMRREGVDLTTIGFISWITVPYSFNYLWAFFLDRYVFSRLGRRRGWLLATQLGLIASLILVSFGQPSISIAYLVITGTILCFFSATQDIAVDAYRREILPDDEQGIGASIGVYGYRVGMLMASGFGLWVVDPKTLDFSFNQMFLLMSALMMVGVVTTLLCAEPQSHVAPLRSLREAIIEPFKEFFKRSYAIWILLFILMFKMGDSVAGAMLSTFYVDLGFDNKTIAEITKGIGFFSSMAGLFVGGWLIFKLEIYRALWIFGILQAVSTAYISLLHYFPTAFTLTQVIALEDFSSGMGTAALVAFMSMLANRRFTATQYALFSSLASFGRSFVSGYSGLLIEMTDYVTFFIICSLLAIPGLILLYKLKQALGGMGEPEKVASG